MPVMASTGQLQCMGSHIQNVVYMYPKQNLLGSTLSVRAFSFHKEFQLASLIIIYLIIYTHDDTW